MTPGVVRLDQMTITGVSVGGCETWFKVQPPGIALDVGHGPEQLTGVRAVFLSHGHLDHAAGLPALLSQRAMHGLDRLDIFCPLGTAGEVVAFVEAAARLEGRSYSYEVRGLVPGERIEVGRGFHVQPFGTAHVLPSLGYHLIQTVRRLRPRFRDRAPAELARLRRQGASIDQQEERLWLSYLGDTGRAVFDRHPEIFRARILMLECTFLAPEHRERAARFGHLHFDDVVSVSDRFSNELIVLHHLSHRFSGDDLRRLVGRKLPRLAAMVRVLGAAER